MRGLEWQFFYDSSEARRDTFLSCGKECRLLSTLGNLFQNTWSRCLIHTLKQLTSASSKPAPPPNPNHFPFPLPFLWPQKPRSFNFGTKRRPATQSYKQDAVSFIYVNREAVPPSTPTTELPVKGESSSFKMTCAPPLKLTRSAIVTVLANVASGFWEAGRLVVLLVLVFSTFAPSEKGPIDIR